MLEDFFKLLLHVMTDETCLVNSVYTRDPRIYVEQHEGNERVCKVIMKVLINILSCYTWIDIQELFEQAKKVLNISNLDEVLGHVAIFDDKLKKLRIKEDKF